MIVNGYNSDNVSKPSLNIEQGRMGAHEVRPLTEARESPKSHLLNHIFYYTQAWYFLIVGNQKKSYQAYLKAKHAYSISQSDKYKELSKKIWGDQLLVPAINIAKSSANSKMDKYKSAHDQLLEQAHYGWLKFNDHHLEKEILTTNGVCAGASLDFAARLVELQRQHPLGTAEFKAGLLQIAEKFKSGVGKKGVANQIFLNTLGWVKLRPSDPNLEKLIADCVADYNAKGDVEEVLNKAKLDKDLLPFVQPVTTLMSILKDQLQGVKPLNAEEFVEVLFTETEGDPEKALPYLPLCHALQAAIRLHQKTITIIQEDSPLAREAKAIDELCSSHLLPEALVELKHKHIHNLKLRYSEWKRIVAEHRGLALEKPNVEISPENKDFENLKQIKDLQEGIYETSFKVIEKSGHAILFIKSGEETFIWDPNFGLIDCQKNPGITLYTLIDTYSEGENHDLEMRRFSPL